MRQSNEIEIQKYLDIFYKFKWHGLIPACVVVVVLAIGSAFLPKIYESKCLVEVDRGSIENPLERQSRPLLGLSDQLAIFSGSALKWNTLSQVVDKVGADAILEDTDLFSLSGPGTKRTAPSSPESHAERETVIDLLRKRIKFKEQPPSFLALTYRGRNSEVNAKILNSLVSTLIEEKTRNEINQAGQNYEFIKAEMESYRQKLEEAEAGLREFKERHISTLASNINRIRSGFGDAEFLRALTSDLTELASNKSELLSCELEAKDLTARLQYVGGKLKDQKELTLSEVKQETNPRLTALTQRIVDMEIELTKLRTNYTDLHPKIIELKSQLEELKKQRDEVQDSTKGSEISGSEISQLNPVYELLSKDRENALVRLEVLKNRMASLKGEIDKNEEKVRSMPAQEQQLLTLTRNYEVTLNIYNMFAQKLEEVRLKEKLATEDTNRESFKILEYAQATFTPVAPERLKLSLMIALIGVGAAVGIMALMDFLDDSFKNVEEAKAFIDKPLLGTVPSLTENGKNGHFVLSKKLLKAIGRS